MKDKSMVFGEGQQSSNKNTEKCREMHRRGKNRRIKGNPNVYKGKTDVCKRKDVELLVRDAEVAFYLTNPSIFGWVVLFSFTSVR